MLHNVIYSTQFNLNRRSTAAVVVSLVFTAFMSCKVLAQNTASTHVIAIVTTLHYCKQQADNAKSQLHKQPTHDRGIVIQFNM